MKLRNQIISTMTSVLLFGLLTVLAVGQSPVNRHMPANATASAEKAGVLVETVTKSSDAEKAGLQPGDVLLHWSRGDSAGEIESPFDVSQIEIEQAPRGPVTLEGLEGPEKRVWTLGPSDWGLKTRPYLAPDILSLYHEGEDLAKAGKLTQATERWRSATQKVTAASLRLWLLFHTAEAFTGARQWKEADAAYQEASQQTESAGPEVKAQLLRAWAKAFEQRADWANAEKHYQEATADSRIQINSLIFADILDGIGVSALRLGDLDTAEKYDFQALAIQRRLAPESLSLAKSLNGLGMLAWRHGDLDKEEMYHSQALAIQKKLAPGSLDVAVSLHNLGILALSRGNLSEAEEYFHEALAIREKLIPASFDVAASLNNLGNVNQVGGDLAKADEYRSQALAILENLAPDSLAVTTILNNLGIDAWYRGDLPNAERYYHRALAIQEKLAPESPDVANSFINLGGVALNRGDFAKAEEYNRRALAIREKLSPESLEVAESLTNLGEVLQKRGDLRKAEECNRRALAINEKQAPDSLDVADSLKVLGFVAQNRGDLAMAEQYFRRDWEIRGKLAPNSLEAAETLTNLGNIIRDRGDPDKAEDYYRQALAIQRNLAPKSKGYAETLADLAGVMSRKGELEAAAPLFDQALNALESQTARLGGSEDTRSNFRAKYLSYYQNYIDLLLRQKQPEIAFQVLERSRAQTLLEMLAEAHIDVRKGVAPALLEQERSLTADITAKSGRRTRLLSDKHTEEQIAAVNQEIEKLLAQRKDVEEQIRVSGPEYAALTQPQPLSAKEVQQQLLDDDTLLLAYALGEERSYVFAVTSNSLNAYELPKRAEIERAARQVRELLTANRSVDGESGVQKQARLDQRVIEYGKAAASLSQMVLGPVAAQLRQKRLLIVGDGALQYISFAALPTPTSIPTPLPQSASASGLVASGTLSPDHEGTAPLVVEHEIVNLPSASVLAVLRQQSIGRKLAPKTVAVLADPVFAADDVRVGNGRAARKQHNDAKHGLEDEARLAASSSEPGSAEHLTRSVADVGLQTQRAGSVLPRLPFSRREARAILSVTPAGQGMEAVDFQASRATATDPKLAQYRIVHFATHGLLDNEHPELSGLVFSLVDQNGKPQNGFLELEDVYNLNLPADLVVLSACETGLGKEVRGEGLVGLTRGFMYAGAPRVVASLWSVDDVATEELMVRFYKAMEQQGMRPAAALRQAQVAMSKEERWSDPYYWAGFVLEGEWK